MSHYEMIKNGVIWFMSFYNIITLFEMDLKQFPYFSIISQFSNHAFNFVTTNRTIIAVSVVKNTNDCDV